MKELIKITESNGQKAVSARELHAFLVVKAKGGQVGEDFSNWIKRMILHLDLKDGIDYLTIEYDYMGNVISKFSESDNQRVAKRDYVLTIDSSKEISIIQNNDKGKEARRYFIDAEKAFRQARANPEIPQSFAEALMLAARQAEQLELQQKELKTQAPKVEYFNKVIESKGLLTVNMIASYLNITHIKLNKLLCEWGVQYKQSGAYFLYEKYRDKGYTEHKPHPYTDSSGQIRTRQHMYWTEKGKEFILSLYNAHFGVSTSSA